MKTSRISILNQRKIIEARLKKWRSLRGEIPPPSGWISAIRGALGITTRQLGALMGTSQANVRQLEKREAAGKATLESVERAAKAMGCRLVYVLVPSDLCESLDEIIDRRAQAVAREILSQVEHSMRLEKQGTATREDENELQQIVSDLKSRLDRRIWDVAKPERNRARK